MNITLNKSTLGPVNSWMVRMLLRLSLRFARVTSQKRNAIGLAMVSACAQVLGVLMYSFGARRTV